MSDLEAAAIAYVEARRVFNAAYWRKRPRAELDQAWAVLVAAVAAQ